MRVFLKKFKIKIIFNNNAIDHMTTENKITVEVSTVLNSAILLLLLSFPLFPFPCDHHEHTHWQPHKQRQSQIKNNKKNSKKSNHTHSIAAWRKGGSSSWKPIGALQIRRQRRRRVCLTEKEAKFSNIGKHDHDGEEAAAAVVVTKFASAMQSTKHFSHSLSLSLALFFDAIFTW